MQEIYYTSDFKIIETGEDFNSPFRFKYSVSDGHTPYIVCFDGTKYINCKVNENGGLDVFFKKQRMGVGQLQVEKSILRKSANGSCHWVKSNVAQRDYYLTDQAVTIKADVVADGVEVSNIDADVTREGSERAVELKGDIGIVVDDEIVELY